MQLLDSGADAIKSLFTGTKYLLLDLFLVLRMSYLEEL